jgi:hypothetical protein
MADRAQFADPKKSSLAADKLAGDDIKRGVEEASLIYSPRVPKKAESASRKNTRNFPRLASSYGE